MSSAIAAWVYSLEEVYILLQGFALLFGRLIGESCEGGVENLPCCPAEFCSEHVVSLSGAPGVRMYLAVAFPSFSAIGSPGALNLPVLSRPSVCGIGEAGWSGRKLETKRMKMKMAAQAVSIKKRLGANAPRI